MNFPSATDSRVRLAHAQCHLLAAQPRRPGTANAWLDQRLQALSAEDRAVIARATALLSSIADS